MIRIIIENLLLFLLPTALYLGYVLVMRRMQSPNAPAGAPGTGTQGAGALLDDAPVLWLFGAGAVLVVVTLIAFGSTSGGRPGQHYEPSVLKDGQIEPSHIQ